jgi:hypothetical protein
MNKFKDFALKHFELSLVILVFLGVIGTAFLIQYNLAFLNFFFLPVILAGHFLGKRQGVLTAFLSILVVVGYLVITRENSQTESILSLYELINVLSWGSFLLLTGAIIGTASEQRTNRLKKMRAATIGILEIIFKYLEYGDEQRPPSVRISHLAGKIAAAAGLETREIENVKSAALLSESLELHKSLSDFYDISDFWSNEVRLSEAPLSDKEKVILKSTSSLLDEIHPLLEDYYLHYIKDAENLDKDLSHIKIESSIIALANIYEKISQKGPPFMEVNEFSRIQTIRNLGGRTFPEIAVQAFMTVISKT